MQCLQDGDWEGTLPKCELRTCEGAEAWTCLEYRYCHVVSLNGLKVPGCFKSGWFLSASAISTGRIINLAGVLVIVSSETV